MELKTDSFDYDIVAKKIKEFLELNNISTVTLFYYNIEEDHEDSKEIKTNDIQKTLLEIFDEDGQFFRFSLESPKCKFEFDSYEFCVEFLAEDEQKFNSFKENLLSD